MSSFGAINLKTELTGQIPRRATDQKDTENPKHRPTLET